MFKSRIVPALVAVAAVLLCTPCRADHPSLGCFVNDVDFPEFKRHGVEVAGCISSGPAAGQLQFGDIISSIGGKLITDHESYSEALKSIADNKPTEVVFFRDSKKEWNRRTTNIKPAMFNSIINSAMKPAKDDPTTHDYQASALPPYKAPFVKLRVREVDDQFFPVVQFFYTGKNWRLVEKLVFSSSTGFYSMEFKVVGVGETARLVLTSEQLAEIKEILSGSSVVVRLEGQQYKKEHELSDQEWVGINTAIAFYEMKRGDKK